MVRARRQSGSLSIEHIQGGRIEEGEIYFHNGRAIHAQVGQLTGQDAINWLLTWHNVRFAFTNDAPEPSASAAPVTGPITTPSRLTRQDISGVPEVVNGSSSSAVIRTSPAPFLPSAGMGRIVPQKRRLVEDVSSLPLTRRQRYIYFLVDGRRSIADLSRTTGKSIQEVELILRELQEQGLIAI